MRASYQFLGGIAFLFAAALVFSAMRHQAGFGTAADWAAASANVAVVITSLYLAGAERRLREENEQRRITVARDGLRASVRQMVELGEDVTNWLGTDGGWPSASYRRDYKLMNETVHLEWMDVEVAALNARDRVIGRRIAPKLTALHSLIATLVEQEAPTAVQQSQDLANMLDDVMSLTVDLRDLGN